MAPPQVRDLGASFDTADGAVRAARGRRALTLLRVHDLGASFDTADGAVHAAGAVEP